MRDAMESVPGAGDSAMWYNLCLMTIGLSAALYLSGRKSLGMFIGLWPPTMAAFGNRAEMNEEITHLIEGRPIHRIGGGDVTPRAGAAQAVGGGEPRPRA